MSTQIEKIKEELERRMNQFKKAKEQSLNFTEGMMYCARIDMCEETLSFIELLEEGRI